jgi:hypothetical protein
MREQSWIHSRGFDLAFILLPPFIVLGIIALFSAYILPVNNAMPEYVWVLLIVFVDVSHVYSTLYRTYFDKETMQQHGTALLLIPLCCFVFSVLLFSAGPHIFWRVMAYLAVFHFIRQQYGFMKIYSRKEQPNKILRNVDALAVYSATLYPIIYWHCKGDRSFNWFAKNDFIVFESEVFLLFSQVVFFLVLFVYLFKEVFLLIKYKSVNWPKNILIIGTYLSWYFGIIYFNGDYTFTFLNVVSHGIPYIALVWIYGNRKYAKEEKSLWLKRVFSVVGIPLFIAIPFLFAFIEEGLWDAMVWREHDGVFQSFYFVQEIQNSIVLCFVVSLLTLPQLTHYVLDGFIWKLKKDDYDWKKYTL